MPLLLDGERLAGEAAVAAGLAHRVVKPGEEIAAAEAWLLSSPEPVQPWDREDWVAPSPSAVSAALEPIRRAALKASLGHYPAVFAILDCVEFGAAAELRGRHAQRDGELLSSGAASRTARDDPDDVPRPRRLRATGAQAAIARGGRRDRRPPCAAELERSRDRAGALARAGFSGFGEAAPVATRPLPGYWIDGDDAAAASRARGARAHQAAVAPLAAGRSEEDLRVADYAAVRQAGYPAYLGGPFAFAAARAS